MKHRGCKQQGQVYSGLWPAVKHSFTVNGFTEKFYKHSLTEKQNSLRRKQNPNQLKGSSAFVIAMTGKLSNPFNSIYHLCRWVKKCLRHRTGGTVAAKQHYSVGTEASRSCEHTWVWGHCLAKWHFLLVMHWRRGTLTLQHSSPFPAPVKSQLKELVGWFTQPPCASQSDG